MKANKGETFRVDNRLIENAPSVFGAKLAKTEGNYQLSLPGFPTPFGPFDYWATIALYSMLDPDQPANPVRTTPTVLVEVLQFSREVSNAYAGYETYETFASDSYRMVEDALQRLFTVEVSWRNRWKVKTAGKRGRPKRQWVVTFGRIVTSLSYVYPPGVTPPSRLPADKRRNVNRAKTEKGEAGPPIWREVEGPRPVAIEYRLSPDLVKGLTNEDPNIGATILPRKIFSLRKTFGRNPTATKLLVWVCRQTAKTTKRNIDGLAFDELNLDRAHARYNRDGLLKAFAMLKEAGVVESFAVEGDEAGPVSVVFTKTEDWHFPTSLKGKPKPPALPPPAPEGDQAAKPEKRRRGRPSKTKRA